MIVTISVLHLMISCFINYSDKFRNSKNNRVLAKPIWIVANKHLILDFKNPQVSNDMEFI